MKKKKLQQMLDNRHRPPAKGILYTRHSEELIARIKVIAETETKRVGKKVHSADIVDLALTLFANDYEKESA